MNVQASHSEPGSNATVSNSLSPCRILRSKISILTRQRSRKTFFCSGSGNLQEESWVGAMLESFVHPSFSAMLACISIWQCSSLKGSSTVKAARLLASSMRAFSHVSMPPARSSAGWVGLHVPVLDGGAALNSAGWLGLQDRILDERATAGTVRAHAGAHLLIQHVEMQ